LGMTLRRLAALLVEGQANGTQLGRIDRVVREEPGRLLI
jgi:hypothetical protein